MDFDLRLKQPVFVFNENEKELKKLKMEFGREPPGKTSYTVVDELRTRRFGGGSVSEARATVMTGESSPGPSQDVCALAVTQHHSAQDHAQHLARSVAKSEEKYSKRSPELVASTAVHAEENHGMATPEHMSRSVAEVVKSKDITESSHKASADTEVLDLHLHVHFVQFRTVTMMSSLLAVCPSQTGKRSREGVGSHMMFNMSAEVLHVSIPALSACQPLRVSPCPS